MARPSSGWSGSPPTAVVEASTKGIWRAASRRTTACSNYFEACRANLTPEARLNQRRFTGWCLAWALSFVGATWLLTNETVAAAPLTWLVALFPTFLGLLLLRSYVRFFRLVDELVQKVQLETLAFGFGAGFAWAVGRLLAMRRYA